MAPSFSIHGFPASSCRAQSTQIRLSFNRCRPSPSLYATFQPHRFLPRRGFTNLHPLLRGIFSVAQDAESSIHSTVNRNAASRDRFKIHASEEKSPVKEKRNSRKSSLALIKKEDEPCAKVEFRVKFRTDYGNQIKIVGSAAQFGAWAIAKSPAMKWSEGDIWRVSIDLPVRNIFEYKYVVVDVLGASVIEWQKGNNCVLAIGVTDTSMTVHDNWEGNPGACVTSKGKGMASKEERLLDWAEEVKSMAPESTALVLEQQEKIESIQQENQIAKQEVSRLKSELRMVSLTRQTAEQQVKDLQQENRRLMALLSEQQNVHKTVMQQTLTMLAETEAMCDVDATSVMEDVSTPEATGNVKENGSSPPMPKSQKTRRKSPTTRSKKTRISTQTAAIASQE